MIPKTQIRTPAARGSGGRPGGSALRLGFPPLSSLGPLFKAWLGRLTGRPQRPLIETEPMNDITKTIVDDAKAVAETVVDNVKTTIHNFDDMLAGKTDFNGFKAGEGAMIEADIAKLPAPLQPAAELLYSSFKAGASVVVGLGLTAIGPVLSNSTDAQATLVLNLMQAAGLPTNRVLTEAEHAVLVQLISGLKAGLDRIGLRVTTAGAQALPAPK